MKRIIYQWLRNILKSPRPAYRHRIGTAIVNNQEVPMIAVESGFRQKLKSVGEVK